MKYKLINKKTGEETLCDKVTIDGFDYYVSDEKTLFSDGKTFVTKENIIHMAYGYNYGDKVVIASNNPIDIPKVVDEVEELANQKTLPHLRAVYIEAYNKSQETHPFSEEDMIEFVDWLFTDCSENGPFGFSCKGNAYSNKELLQIWKEQKIKTLYYE